jgi:hypothetical protein
MWSTEYSTETDLSPEAIWASMRALRTGAIPSANGDRFELQGPFAPGSIILSTPEGLGVTLESRITEAVENETYADETQFNDLILENRYHLTRSDRKGTRVTRGLIITGPGAADTGPTAGPRIAQDYPEAMDELIDVARRNFSPRPSGSR